jgi:hypothetical protein
VLINRSAFREGRQNNPTRFEAYLRSAPIGSARTDFVHQNTGGPAGVGLRNLGV